MEKFIESLDKISSLNEIFKCIETESLVIQEKPKDKYLCFRLDGINLSNRHLKNVARNERFESTLDKSIKSVYSLMKKKTPTNSQNIFLCIFSSSDEVSYIFNQSPNYYEDRIFKIGTTLAGIMSSSMTGYFLTNPKNKEKGFQTLSFDSRPIILDSIDSIEDYVEYRRLIYIRSCMAKTLKLKSDLDDKTIYRPEHKNNIQWLSQQIEAFDLISTFKNLIKGSILYIPSSNGELESYRLDEKNNIENLFTKVTIFEKIIYERNEETR